MNTNKTQLYIIHFIKAGSVDRKSITVQSKSRKISIWIYMRIFNEIKWVENNLIPQSAQAPWFWAEQSIVIRES